MTAQHPTTDDPITTGPAVGTATVHPSAPTLKTPERSAIPPTTAAPVDEVLRWVAEVVTTAGPTLIVDVSTPIKQITVLVSGPVLFSRWQEIVGAVALPTRNDAIGTFVSAATVYPGRWVVEIDAHVRNPS